MYGRCDELIALRDICRVINREFMDEMVYEAFILQLGWLFFICAFLRGGFFGFFGLLDFPLERARIRMGGFCTASSREKS